jgi:hypothetical protein
MGSRKKRLTHAPPPMAVAIAKGYERYLKVALALPGAEASTSYGTPAVKVRGKILSRWRTGRVLSDRSLLQLSDDPDAHREGLAGRVDGRGRAGVAARGTRQTGETARRGVGISEEVTREPRSVRRSLPRPTMSPGQVDVGSRRNLERQESTDADEALQLS